MDNKNDEYNKGIIILYTLDGKINDDNIWNDLFDKEIVSREFLMRNYKDKLDLGNIVMGCQLSAKDIKNLHKYFD